MAEGERPDDDDLGEEPSPRKIEEARKEGQLPMSQAAVLTAGILVGAGSLMSFGPAALHGFAASVRISTDVLGRGAEPGGGAIQEMLAAASPAVVALLGVIVLGATAALATTLAQTQGGLWPNLLVPKLDRVLSFSRLTHPFTREGLTDLGIAALKTVLLLGIAYVSIWPLMLEVRRSFIAHEPRAVLESAWVPLREGTPKLLAGLVGLAVLDVFVVRARYFKRMRSTKEEMKREHKEEEGDPLIKGKRRRKHREFATGRASVEVPKADALVVNPTHIAIAIRYRKKTDKAPRVTAKGKGKQAEFMRELARENGIPIMRDVPLARFLHKKVKVGREVPAETYKAVAAVLAFVYRVTGRPPGTGLD